MFRGLKVSHAIYLILLIVAFFVSYDNIHQLALAQHATGFAAMGIAIVVSGTAALTVYVSVIAQTRLLTWTAVGFALFFGAVSGMLQYQHYLLLGAPERTALGFGWGVPVMEAMIAIIEGLIAWEMKTLAPDVTAELRATIARMQAEATNLLAKLEDTLRGNERLQKQVESLKRDVADARHSAADARNSAAIAGVHVMDSSYLPVPVTATMIEVGKSERTQKNVQDALALLGEGPVPSAQALADRAKARNLNHLSGSRTVARVLNTAVENGLVVKDQEVGYRLAEPTLA